MNGHLQRHPHFGDILVEHYMENHRNPLLVHAPNERLAIRMIFIKRKLIKNLI
ncbi:MULTISPECIES: hypothetical protein [Bacillus cereus group]|uniref:hypothetical protein n=1 Tax=Bacillus cereus group TaxID=86661 RepID=UPI001401C3CC|nr:MULTISPECIES: hypothetical protein [Bacillus cereus group]